MVSAAVQPSLLPATRRERRRHEVRARIIEAAVRLVDDKGFAGTTVAEICDAADVAEKTFFNHFASKPDMLREIARVELGVLLDLLAAAGREAAPSDVGTRLDRFFRLLADRVEAAGPMRRELLTELVHLAHETGTGSAQAHTLHAAFARLVHAGMAPGRRPAGDPAVDVVLGAFYVLMLDWANIEGYPFRKRASAMARFLGDAIAETKRRKR